MNDLRNALHDLADSAPASPLPTDLWERGRASRRTAHLQLIAAVLVIIACLVASVGLLRPVVTAAPASGPETDGTLPAQVYEPGGDLKEALIHSGVPRPGGVVDDLSSIGQISTAVTRSPYLPVLVGASDGAHHVVDLPDLIARGVEPGAPVTPSPDGWKVAYPWAEVGDRTADTHTGVAWVDLRTGVVTQIRVRGLADNPVLVSEISWSSDSQRLAWTGDAIGKWDATGSKSDSVALEVGTIRVDDSETEPTTWSLRDSWSAKPEGTAIAVDSQGSPVLLAGREIWTFEGEQPRSQVVVDKGEQTFWTTAVLSEGRFIGGGNTSNGVRVNPAGTVEIDLRDDTPRAMFLSWGNLPAGGLVEPLGLTPGGGLVASTTNPSEEGSVKPARIEARGAGGETEALTRWDGSAAASLRVATDLADRPVGDFPEPEWPLSIEQKVARIALATGAVLLAGGVVVLIWRRRRQVHLPG